jgi:phage repressor protein C with HTH and peptisase S24 domain
MVDGKKISSLLKQKDITSKELSLMLENLGIKIGEESIRKYRTGSVNIPSSTVSAIAEILNVTEQELYYNFEEQKEKIVKDELKNNPTKYSNYFIKTIDNSKIDIPYFENSYACAGAGLINYDETPKPITFDRGFLETQLNMKNFKNVHIIKVKGNSMEPTFKSGTFLMINPIENEGNAIENGSIYVVQYYDDTMVKRVVRNNKTKEVLLHSDNKEEHPSIEIKNEDVNDFHIIGRVIANFNFI